MTRPNQPVTQVIPAKDISKNMKNTGEYTFLSCLERTSGGQVDQPTIVIFTTKEEIDDS